VSGHLHQNIVTARPSTDPAHSGAQYGHWEVQTASLRDFPQQLRTFEIVRNSDNTISILIRDVDPAVAEGSLAALSREYAVAISQLYGIVSSPYGQGPYNAELVKELSPRMQEVVAACGTPLHGAKWSNDWGWVGRTLLPLGLELLTGNWFLPVFGRARRRGGRRLLDRLVFAGLQRLRLGLYLPRPRLVAHHKRHERLLARF
jgi:hypothetical protein